MLAISILVLVNMEDWPLRIQVILLMLVVG